MKKSTLEIGQVLQTRNGRKYLVSAIGNTRVLFTENENLIELDKAYDEDLNSIWDGGNPILDITAVLELQDDTNFTTVKSLLQRDAKRNWKILFEKQEKLSLVKFDLDEFRKSGQLIQESYAGFQDASHFRKLTDAFQINFPKGDESHMPEGLLDKTAAIIKEEVEGIINGDLDVSDSTLTINATDNNPKIFAYGFLLDIYFGKQYPELVSEDGYNGLQFELKMNDSRAEVLFEKLTGDRLCPCGCGNNVRAKSEEDMSQTIETATLKIIGGGILGRN